MWKNQLTTLDQCSSKCLQYRCGICGGCLEAHCTCGRFFDRICKESTACECRSMNRCAMCIGCRESHCKCRDHLKRMELLFLHAKEAEIDRNNRKKDTIKGKGKEKVPAGRTPQEREILAVCSCPGPLSSPYSSPRSSIASLRKEAAQLGRALAMKNLPTISNPFDKKELATAVGHTEHDISTVHTDRHSRPLLPYNVFRSWKTRARAVDVLPYADPNSEFPLGRKATTNQEALENEDLRIVRNQPARVSTDHLVENAQRLEKYLTLYEREMPQETLVDYLIYLASIKISDIPELIGTFSESAAITTGIILEEYIRQSVEDLVENKGELEVKTDVQMERFVEMLLSGADWRSKFELSDVREEAERVFSARSLRNFWKEDHFKSKWKRSELQSKASAVRSKKDRPRVVEQCISPGELSFGRPSYEALVSWHTVETGDAESKDKSKMTVKQSGFRTREDAEEFVSCVDNRVRKRRRLRDRRK